jgi:outer membrane protein TolC
MRLSLNEAISLSLQNSGKLKIAGARVEEAIAASQEAKNNRLPDLKATASYLQLNSPSVDLRVKLNSGSGSEGSMKVDHLMYGMLNASMPLFSGFRIKYGIESAKYLEQAAKLDAEKDKEEVKKEAYNQKMFNSLITYFIPKTIQRSTIFMMILVVFNFQIT